MTRHRLIRCRPESLVDQVTRRHQRSESYRGRGSDDQIAVSGWLEPNERRLTIAWRHRLPGCLLNCCLVIEQGANGVLAHLDAAPVGGEPAALPDPVSRLAGEVWAARELAAMARVVETSNQSTAMGRRSAGR